MYSFYVKLSLAVVATALSSSVSAGSDLTSSTATSTSTSCSESSFEPRCTFCTPTATEIFTWGELISTETMSSCVTVVPCTETTPPWATSTSTASCYFNGEPWPCTKDTATGPTATMTASDTASCSFNGQPWPCTKDTATGPTATMTASDTASCSFNGEPWPCTKDTSMVIPTTTVYETVPCSETANMTGTVSWTASTSVPPYQNTTTAASFTTTSPPLPTVTSSGAVVVDNKMKVGFWTLVTVWLGMMML